SRTPIPPIRIFGFTPVARSIASARLTASRRRSAQMRQRLISTRMATSRRLDATIARVFYGWLVVAGAFVSHLLSYGVLTMAFGSVALGELTGDTTVARWFVRRRGRALAVSTMGLSTAGIVLPLPIALSIARFGWRGAWLALGGVTLVLGLAATAVMRRQPE